MDENHRKRILENIDNLVNLTEFPKLRQSCISHKLLTMTMVHNICHTQPQKSLPEPHNDYTIERERHKNLFIKITKRGPDAFEKLRNVFKELKYREASKILFGDNDRMISISSSKQVGRPISGNDDDEDDVEIHHNGVVNNNNIDDRDGTENRELSPTFSTDGDLTVHQYKGKIEPKKIVDVRKATKILRRDSIPKTYPMESKNNRGVFFMVNIIDFPSEDSKRKGAEADTQSLLSLFQQLAFKLYSYSNLSRTQFFEILDNLLNTKEIQDTECFVMALMTHGQMEDGIQFIIFNDGSVVKIDEIEKRFYNSNCPQLMGKPKIFIFPYCRGDLKDKGVVIKSNKTQTESMPTSQRSLTNTVQLSDVIQCYATTAGFVAHRDIEDGSWYIQNFVNTIAEYAHNTPFEEMLKIIQSRVSKLRTENNEQQTASFSNIGFNKILYFNPGIYAK